MSNPYKEQIELIQTALNIARQVDLENGVAWMNDMAEQKFAKYYPQLNQVINNILEMGDTGERNSGSTDVADGGSQDEHF